MSQQTKIDARYVQTDLNTVEQKLFNIADDAERTKDKVLIDKITGIKAAVKDAKDYLGSKLDKKTG